MSKLMLFIVLYVFVKIWFYRNESVSSLISICGLIRSYNILYTASRIGMFTCMCRFFSFIHYVPKNPSAIISISICALFTLYPLPIIVPKVRLRENLE